MAGYVGAGAVGPHAPSKGGAKTSFYAVTGATTLSLSVSTSDSQPSSVDWGDGVRVNCASGATVDHTYGAPFTGAVAITTRSGTLVRWSSGSPGWSFNLSALPVGVGVADIYGSNTVTGNLSSIPNATYVAISGSNTVTGNLSSIPNATVIVISGSNTVTGNLSSIPNATIVAISGSNTVTGNLSSIPNATYVAIYGSNTVTGNLSSIPNATVIGISGSNTVTGNLSSIPNATIVDISGSNTVTGNLSSIPNATIVAISGSNTVTGNLSSIPNATVIVISGSNTVSDYTARSWPSSMRHVAVVPVSPGGLSAPEVDQLLINLAAYVTTWVVEKTVRLTGTNAAPTAASASAITTLQGRGVTVVTN